MTDKPEPIVPPELADAFNALAADIPDVDPMWKYPRNPKVDEQIRALSADMRRMHAGRMLMADIREGSRLDEADVAAVAAWLVDVTKRPAWERSTAFMDADMAGKTLVLLRAIGLVP